MLTADLVRVAVRKGALRPQYIDPESETLLEAATQLCAIWSAHLERTRRELDDALDDLVGDETHFGVIRGLSKLLDDRSTWETAAACDPVDVRRAVFEAAAAAHPVRTLPTPDATHRAEVLSRVATALNLSVDQVEAALYADLKSEQRMTAFKTVEPRALLDRYNLALAQGLLLRAHELRIDVDVDRPSRLRALFRALKFHQLMHRTARVDGRWRVIIDGPMSLFQQSQRYGVQMAVFLPTVLTMDRWSIEADVDWRGDGRKLPFRVTPDDCLVSHLRPRGTWISEHEATLCKRVDTERAPWKVSRRAAVVDLGGHDVLVPDFVVEHREDGRRALVEVVGFWRRDSLQRRAALLAEHGPANLVLCVSKRLAADDGSLGELGDNLVEFAAVIPLARFMEVVERVAR